MSAAREVQAIETPTMENLAKAISQGALRGARGNSGVILSQLFRGFSKEIKEVEVIDAQILASALERAAETAYKAVMKPKEGTILTVAKGMSTTVSYTHLMEVLLMFILPIKMKWLAYIDMALYAYSLVVGNWGTRIAIIVSLLNFILFFSSIIRKKGYSPKQVHRCL